MNRAQGGGFMKTHDIKLLGRMLWAAVVALGLLAPAAQAVRIKDICDIEGVRTNKLVGYGLVSGLAGTGDDLGGETQIALLRRLNIRLDAQDIKSKNVAAVMVTPDLPPFAGPGTQIDVTVSALGDSKSLQGGVLLATPLRPAGMPPEAAGSVYAIAQGNLSVGGFATGTSGGQASIVKNHVNTATIPNGAIVEREVETLFATKPAILLKLRTPDFTTANRIAQMINNTLSDGAAQCRDAASVSVKMPASGNTDERVRFVSNLETLEVSPDMPAKVVFNERSGTIVMGGNVRISKALITHGNLIFERREETDHLTQAIAPLVQDGLLTQPQYDAILTNFESTRGSVKATEEKGKFQVLEEGVTINEVARGLNALGVTARDIMAILQALKEAGALQAELVSM
jgi:flagellar P-ring protein precursor FlgI